MTREVIDFGSVPQVAKLLFTKYMYPFQLTGILLLVALVGAVVLARKETNANESDGPTADSTTGEISQKAGR